MSRPDQDAKYLEVARRLGQQASELILQILQLPFTTQHKADHSPVTEADLKSDQLIREGLLKAFPDHGILTEEQGILGKSGSEYLWLVDPLDGTKAFAKKIPGFSVMIGLLKAGRPYLGVVVDPLEGRTYEALRGQGAYETLRGQRSRLFVSNRRQFSEMPLVVSTGFPEATLAKIQQELNGPLLPPINSVGIKVGLLVRQIGDIYINHHSVSYWDTCAPQIILEEAGGIFSNLDGGELTYSDTTTYSHHTKTLASNGARHGDVVSILKGIFPLLPSPTGGGSG